MVNDLSEMNRILQRMKKLLDTSEPQHKEAVEKYFHLANKKLRHMKLPEPFLYNKALKEKFGSDLSKANK